MTTHALRLFRNSVGLMAGAAIAAVDNFAFGGEVSPIVIVAMLLIASATLGLIWGRHGALAAGLVWVWLPLAHIVKRALDLPDTIQPNTYTSIMMLGIFSFVVTGVGLGFGAALRRLLSPQAPESA